MYVGQHKSTHQLLTLHNVIYQLSKRARKEFIQVKKSFFQKVIIKECPLSNHVVLLITNISPSNNANSKNIIIELSDGSYSLPALVTADKPQDGKEERFDCDHTILRMV